MPDEISQERLTRLVGTVSNKSRFMFAGFWVADDGSMHLERMTSQFPTGGFNQAVMLLQEDLVRELENSQMKK